MSAARTILQGGRRSAAGETATSYTLGMPHGSGNEIEIKLPVADMAAIRRRLRAAGARAGPRLHEINVLFDTPEESLRRREMLLRVRVERRPGRGGGARGPQERRALADTRLFPPRGGQRAIVTLKAPPENPDGGGKGAGAQALNGYKVRREVEFEVTDSLHFRELLVSLGFRPAFYYEKFRSEHRSRRLPGVLITLDETPVGNFLEIEGRPGAIDRARAALGYRPEDAILLSYGALYTAHCAAEGREPGDMLF